MKKNLFVLPRGAAGKKHVEQVAHKVMDTTHH